MKDNQSLKSLQESSKLFSLDLCLKNDDFPIITTALEMWNIALEWVVKLEWDSDYKINTSEHWKTHLKPRGILLQKYYLLCERCHSWQNSTDIEVPYNNAMIWFSKIFTELIEQEINCIYYNRPKIVNGNIKKSFLDRERNKSKMLRSFENPFSNTGTEGLKILIDIAIKIAEKREGKRFRETHWTPFLTAFSAHIEEMNSSDWGTTYIKDDKCRFRAGQGRGTTQRLQGTTEQYKKYFFKTYIE